MTQLFELLKSWLFPLTSRTLLFFFAALTFVVGLVWLLLDKPRLEPVTIMLGAITAGIGALQGRRIHWLVSLVLVLLGLGLVGWGIFRAIKVWSPGGSASESGEWLARGDQALATGQIREALDYYQQALVIQREVDDRAGEGTTLNNISAVYHHQGRYDQALEYFSQALVIRREVGDRAREGATLNNVGLVHRAQGRYDQALEYYKQALLIAQQIGDQQLEQTILDNIEDLPDE